MIFVGCIIQKVQSRLLQNKSKLAKQFIEIKLAKLRFSYHIAYDEYKTTMKLQKSATEFRIVTDKALYSSYIVHIKLLIIMELLEIIQVWE